MKLNDISVTRKESFVVVMHDNVSIYLEPEFALEVAENLTREADAILAALAKEPKD